MTFRNLIKIIIVIAQAILISLLLFVDLIQGDRIIVLAGILTIFTLSAFYMGKVNY